ncbi:MAG: ABC transporter ATP-binding protein [Chloroflexota bacterium]
MSFGGVQAVRNVSVSFGRGSITGLIGPNGAGKSTLLAALGGQAQLSGGRIFLGGAEVTHRPPYWRVRHGLSRTFQTTSEFAGLTVFENLLVAGLGRRGASFWRGLIGGRQSSAQDSDVAARARELLARFAMEPQADAYGRELSGGQRRLVEIMRCLMQKPDVILLDEPMVGVAPHLVQRIIDALRGIREQNVALVVVEHALEVIGQLCDRVVVMAQGEVISDGAYADVIREEAVQQAYLR